MSMPAAAQVGRSRPASTRHAPIPDEPYLLMPVPLALDLRDSPLALGVYLLVARAYLVQHGPIPLSAADIQAYDAAGAPSRGAVTRALDRLVAGAWLIPQASPGHKSAYLPAWGRIDGEARPWAIGEPGLARPRAVRARRVPCSLLDVCLGRLTPHPRHPALVERYITRPALALQDVGVYALALAGLVSPAPLLARLGLVNEAGALPPPPPAELLARISQLPLLAPAADAPALSARGLSRVGLSASPAPTKTGGQTLFFVPPKVIGEVIGPVIVGVTGEEAHGKRSSSASPRGTSACECVHLPTHGEIEGRGMNRESTTLCTSNPADARGGGGVSVLPAAAATRPSNSLPTHADPPEVSHTPLATQRRVRGWGEGYAPPPPPPVGTARPAPLPPSAEAETTPSAPPQRVEPAAPQTPTAAATETACLLQTLGVRTDIVRQLADRPVTQVARVIGLARARSDVRDRAAWVVSALRALPADEPETPPADDRPHSAKPIHTHPGLSDEQRDRWIKRFRAAPSPEEQRAVLTRLEQEHPR